MILPIVEVCLSTNKKHDFAGKCQLCHTDIPKAGASLQESNLIDDVDRMCANCHKVNKNTSHPTNVRPTAAIPLERFLDKAGQLTCITCHDVHKEENPSFSRQELSGLIRGHAQGRAFCFTCHNEGALGMGWREMSITFAHFSGELTQKAGGALLDKFSVECLSCHDGTVSKMASVDVAEGDFKHGIGLSHPVGIKYPKGSLSDNDFVPPEYLPEEVKLFNGAVGCLSCHNPYGKEKGLLVKSNNRSALCLTCHKK